MKLKGIRLFFLDCQEGYQREFNYWYDTDHVPENRALPGVFHAQRYVALPEYVALREANQLEGGGGNYLTVYFSEKEILETRADMDSLALQLREKNRFITSFRGGFYGNTFLIETVKAREGLPLSPGAIPLMPHQGVYIILDEILDSFQEEKLIKWYEDVHIPDSLKCIGFAAVLRFRCVNRNYNKGILHYFLLDDDPLRAAKDRQRRLIEWQAQGRLLNFSGLARRIFAGPYRVITPLMYDFLLSS